MSSAMMHHTPLGVVSSTNGLAASQPTKVARGTVEKPGCLAVST